MKKGSPLRQVLKRNRLQQKDVAEALGVTRMAVLCWVQGKYLPGAARMAQLLAFLRKFEPGVTADFLLSQVPVSPLMAGSVEPSSQTQSVPDAKS